MISRRDFIKAISFLTANLNLPLWADIGVKKMIVGAIFSRCDRWEIQASQSRCWAWVEVILVT